MASTPADELGLRERAWREHALRLAFRLTATAIVLGGIPTTLLIGASWAAAAMALSFPMVLAGALPAPRPRGYHLRARLLVLSLLAVTTAGFAQVGPGAGFALAQAAMVTLAGLFLGPGAMRAVLLLAAGADAAAYAGGVLGWLPWPSVPPWDWTRPAVWARLLAPLAFLTPVIGFPVLVVAGRYERLARRREAARRRIAEALASRDRARQERHAADEILAHAQRAQVVGRVGAALAREFDNALVVVRCWAGVLVDARAGAAERSEAVEAILAACRRAAAVARQIMALARPAPAASAAADVGRVVDKVAGLARRILPASVQLEHRAQPGLRAAIDEAALQQVLLNLLLNARDALPRGGRVDLEAEPAAAPGPGAVAVRVTDDGSGMTPEVRARAFEPFFSTRAGGAGLGLACSLALVRQAGGDLTLRTAPGVGTTALVTLASPPPAAGATAPGTPLLPSTARALVVDPDPQLRRVTARALSARGFEVIESGDAAGGVERLRRLRGELHLLCVDATEFTAGVLRLVEECAALFPGAATLALGAPLPGPRPPGAPLAYQAKPFVASELAERAAALVCGRQPA